MRFFQELFPREAFVDKCINFHDGGRYHIETGFYMISASVVKELSALENFETFSGKSDWQNPFLYWSCSPHIYLRKGDFLR